MGQQHAALGISSVPYGFKNMGGTGGLDLRIYLYLSKFKHYINLVLKINKAGQGLFIHSCGWVTVHVKWDFEDSRQFS